MKKLRMRNKQVLREAVDTQSAKLSYPDKQTVKVIIKVHFVPLVPLSLPSHLQIASYLHFCTFYTYVFIIKLCLKRTKYEKVVTSTRQLVRRNKIVWNKKQVTNVNLRVSGVVRRRVSCVLRAVIVFIVFFLI